MKNNTDHFEVLRKIKNKPNSSQRELAEELGFSLGKLNYCLKELKLKGFIKISNFNKSKNKIKYIYVLTPGGISEKTIKPSSLLLHSYFNLFGSNSNNFT